MSDLHFDEEEIKNKGWDLFWELMDGNDVLDDFFSGKIDDKGFLALAKAYKRVAKANALEALVKEVKDGREDLDCEIYGDGGFTFPLG